MTDSTRSHAEMIQALHRNKVYDVLSAERDCRGALHRAETDLAMISDALDKGNGVPAGISGTPRFASTGRDLSDALVKREAAYRSLVETERLAESLGVELPSREEIMGGPVVAS
jgi:hypothetical protein